MGFYAGDSWRIKPNVTFNYGLRWEYDGPPWDKLNEYWMLQNTNDVFGVSGPGNLSIRDRPPATQMRSL